MFSIVMRIDSASYAFPKRFKFFLLEFHSVVHIFPHFFFFLFLIGLDGKGSFPIEDDSRGLVQRGQGECEGISGLAGYLHVARSLCRCLFDRSNRSLLPSYRYSCRQNPANRARKTGKIPGFPLFPCTFPGESRENWRKLLPSLPTFLDVV